MKFCYECGYKLEGFEKFCPECGKEFKSPEDTEHFLESIFNQFISDVDRIKKETIQMFDELDVEDALDDFSKNSKKALNRDIIYINRARSKLENSGDNQRVIYLCNKALLVDELNWEAYYLKGRALFNLERYDEAIEELINCLALNEDYVDAILYIAKAYNSKGDIGYALKVYDSVLNIDEKNFEALCGKALIFFDQKDYFEAEKYFSKANNFSVLPKDYRYKWDVCSKKLKEE